MGIGVYQHRRTLPIGLPRMTLRTRHATGARGVATVGVRARATLAMCRAAAVSADEGVDCLRVEDSGNRDVAWPNSTTCDQCPTIGQCGNGRKTSNDALRRPPLLQGRIEQLMTNHTLRTSVDVQELAAGECHGVRATATRNQRRPRRPRARRGVVDVHPILRRSSEHEGVIADENCRRSHPGDG